MSGQDMECVEFEDVPAVEAESDKAILVLLEDYSDEPMWIPKSQIHDNSEVYKKGTSGTLIITKWIAEQKGVL